jgi:hypothetical protein
VVEPTKVSKITHDIVKLALEAVDQKALHTHLTKDGMVKLIAKTTKLTSEKVLIRAALGFFVPDEDSNHKKRKQVTEGADYGQSVGNEQKEPSKKPKHVCEVIDLVEADDLKEQARLLTIEIEEYTAQRSFLATRSQNRWFRGGYMTNSNIFLVDLTNPEIEAACYEMTQDEERMAYYADKIGECKNLLRDLQFA